MPVRYGISIVLVLTSPHWEFSGYNFATEFTSGMNEIKWLLRYTTIYLEINGTTHFPKMEMFTLASDMELGIKCMESSEISISVLNSSAHTVYLTWEKYYSG